jgi:hypothetical protein
MTKQKTTTPPADAGTPSGVKRQHDADYAAVKAYGGPEEAERAGLLVDAAYEPSLITGRCRCPACRPAPDSR